MSDIVEYVQQDAVAVITLNRPDNMNAFTNELRADLLEALERAQEDDTVSAVVLTGEGRCFSAGADLKHDSLDRPIAEKLQHEYRPVQEAIASMPKPVIAAVPGSAAGIGLSVALQCDLLVIADDAFQLSVESERIPADRCVELGLANKSVPAEELRPFALEWARRLAERAPLSLAATKEVMRHAADNDWGSSYDLEADLQNRLFGSEDNVEGITAFFEKRTAKFKGK
jgi:2-(1,2-epoxy-1,2-dihydrophenyl)acetyl-CoA isomerase